jgi:hypothetical protein
VILWSAIFSGSLGFSLDRQAACAVVIYCSNYIYDDFKTLEPGDVLVQGLRLETVNKPEGQKVYLLLATGDGIRKIEKVPLVLDKRIFPALGEKRIHLFQSLFIRDRKTAFLSEGENSGKGPSRRSPDLRVSGLNWRTRVRESLPGNLR